MRNATAVFIAAVFTGCGGFFAFIVQFHPDNEYTMHPVYEQTRFTNYEVHPDEQTETGILVDTSDQQVDLSHIDVLTFELEGCMSESINRSAYTVKIAPDWRYQECADRQLFDCKLPEFEQSGCDAFACPCGCAGILQYPSTVVVTPDLAAYKHEMIHLVTGTTDHADPLFAMCQ